MANYNLVINSAFRPFSYAEMLASVDAATKAHQALEDEYAALNTLASTLEKLAALESSSNAYKTYLKYKERLNALTDLLSKHGLNPLSRRTALDARADYASSIVPIQEALTRRQALADELRKAALSNPTVMFERDFRTINEKSAIDNLVGNDLYDYGRSMTGALLMAMSKQASAGLAKDMFERGDLKLILPFQYEREDTKGAKGEDILAALYNEADKGNPKAVAALQGILNLVETASGMKAWENYEELKPLIRHWEGLGLWDAVGGTTYEKYTDDYGKQKALIDDKIAAEKRAREEAAIEEAGRKALKMYLENGGNWYSKDEIATANNEYVKLRDEFVRQGYLTSSEFGYKMTEKGKNAILEAANKEDLGLGTVNRINAMKGGNKTDVDLFVRWVLNTTGINLFKGTSNAANLGAANYLEASRALRNINKNLGTETTPIGDLLNHVFRYALTKTESDMILRQVRANLSSDASLYTAGKIEATGQDDIKYTVGRGKAISKKEFEKMMFNSDGETKAKNGIAYIVNSPDTDLVFLQTTDGTKIHMPAGVIGDLQMSNLSAYNRGYRHSGSTEEAAVNISNGSVLLTSILNHEKGTAIERNDGTIIIPYE